MNNPNRYDPRLSGLRGIAALMVVTVHVASYGILPFSLGVFVYDYSQLTAGLWIGVPIFLMLSMLLLLKSLDGNPSLGHYFRRRVKRIWPIYFASVILIGVAFQGLYHFTLWDYLSFFTFTQYYRQPALWGPMGVFWTLQLEEAAYLFIPLIHRSQHKELIASVLIAASLAWIVALFNTSLLTSTGWGLQNLWFSPPTWLIAYGLGILIYTGRFAGGSWRVIRWATIPSLMLAALPLPFYSNSLSQQYELFYLLGLLAFASVVANPPSFLRYGAVVGESSYALYASHLAFLFAFGVLGIPLALGVSFAAEFALRPREISSRLNSPLPPEQELSRERSL
jgi:peptidoglycan/LPS O-acetylase OafA/YrhL